MLKQRVYRYNVPEDVLLLDILNYTNKRRYTLKQIKFGLPEALGHLESRVMVAPTDAVNWVGAVPLNYERHDLGQYFRDNPIVIDVDRYDNDYILEAILNQHRVLFEAHAVEIDHGSLSNYLIEPVMDGLHYEGFTDPENFAARQKPIYTDGIRNLTLTAKPESKIWVGSTEVLVRRTGSLMDQSISKTLSIRKYFAETRDRKLAIEVLYDIGRDASELYNELKTLKTGEVLLTDHVFTNVAKVLTGDDWLSKDVHNDFNLYGSVVMYHGHNVGEYSTGYNEFSHVVAIALGEGCANLKGIWIIHYNDPTIFRHQHCLPDRFPLQTIKG